MERSKDALTLDPSVISTALVARSSPNPTSLVGACSSWSEPFTLAALIQCNPSSKPFPASAVSQSVVGTPSFFVLALAHHTLVLPPMMTNGSTVWAFYAIERCVRSSTSDE